jgi:predicted RNA-binding Zn-ribbon protein involved in translation (DUF1610 family)
MTTDRKALIRLASKMPVGDPVRRVVLAELQKESAYRKSDKAKKLDSRDGYDLWEDRNKWVITDRRGRVYLEPFNLRRDADKAWGMLKARSAGLQKTARFPKGLVKTRVGWAEHGGVLTIDLDMPTSFQRKFLASGSPYVCAVCGYEDGLKYHSRQRIRQTEEWELGCPNCGSTYMLYGERDPRPGETLEEGYIESMSTPSWTQSWGNFRDEPVKGTWLYKLAKDYEHEFDDSGKL